MTAVVYIVRLFFVVLCCAVGSKDHVFLAALFPAPVGGDGRVPSGDLMLWCSSSVVCRSSAFLGELFGLCKRASALLLAPAVHPVRPARRWRLLLLPAPSPAFPATSKPFSSSDPPQTPPRRPGPHNHNNHNHARPVCPNETERNETKRKRNENGTTDTLADHSHWVVSLAALPPGIVPECPQGGLVTGCMDKLVRVYDHLGKQHRMLQGHDGGVISFSWTATGQVRDGRGGGYGGMGGRRRDLGFGMEGFCGGC